MNKYSQFGEEEIIKSYFPEGYSGGCIDIGASNGINMNNTKLFEDEGWYCLCTEPNPRYFKELKVNRKNSVECAISNLNGYFPFNIVTIGYDHENKRAIQDAGSSLRIDERLLQNLENHGVIARKDMLITPITVEVMTLDKCIEKFYKYDKIDFLSIDTEGTELDVLKGFSIERWQPKLFVIENNFNDTHVEKYLELFGYKKVNRIVVNDFYTK